MARPGKSAGGSSRGDAWFVFNLFASVFLVWLIAGFATLAFTADFQSRFPLVKLSDTGTFGDSFGAVNSLFSALGVAGVAYALILQYREQHDARREAEESRGEAEKSRRHDAELAMLATLLNAHQSNYQNVLIIQKYNLDGFLRRGFFKAFNIATAKFNNQNAPSLMEIRRLMILSYEKMGMEFPANIPDPTAVPPVSEDDPEVR